MKFIVGIDLGTTNCAVAFADPSQGANAQVHDFPIPQMLRPGEVASLPLLPSCVYIPGEHELPPGSPKFIAGAFARWQGARVPGRMVASAKSWLSHQGVDRCAPILPWGAPAEITRLSPVEASSLLLKHIADAWDNAHPEAPLKEQEVVITVPASFDEVARTLTVDAARAAGLERLTLVEEPQAAFYDFIGRHPHDLPKMLRYVRLALVVDVGGGTTDFTLIQIEGEELKRIAVGDHLMLGGDNMDAALARRVEERFSRKLSATQWTQLVAATREAKEALLGAKAPDRYNVAVAAEGSRLLGGAMSAEILRSDVEQTILDGFFPNCGPSETPRRTARTALQELGLPYAQDPAITRHLAGFLHQHRGQSSELPRPDAILLNGGVFNSPKISRRLIEGVSAWWPGAPEIPTLPHESLDFAVARGAVFHGLARRGLTRRIGGGSAHALYIGLAAEKGQSTQRAICLIPRGQEEGQPVELTSRTFDLMLGRPVQFPVYSTQADRPEKPGDVVEVTEEFTPLPPMHTLLKTETHKTATSRPVHLRATLTELGTLELWCVANTTEEKWRLEFNLRGAAAASEPVEVEQTPRFGEASALLGAVFGKQAPAASTKEAKQLWRTLEKSFGPREQWAALLLREMWSILWESAKGRLRSAEHERAFFQAAGYTLRPGFGYPLDQWRCEQMFQLFAAGVKHHKEQPVWSEFWVMWRRIAGGLDEARQRELWAYLKPHLARRVGGLEVARSKGVQPEGLDEMVRAAASLEHLEPAEKVELGGWIVERLRNPATAAGPWAWALGRLGARAPLYGSGHRTVDVETVTSWLEVLLANGLRSADGSAFAAAQLARLTGDRSRDVDDQLRGRVAEALSAAGAAAGWIQMVREVVALEKADAARALGDTVPIGLRLKG